MLPIIALAIVLRVGFFPFAENKHGDAPMRALIAEWMNLYPHAAAQPSTYCQFGPLHTTLMRPFIGLDPVAARSSRYLSLLAGLLVFFPFLRLARRLTDPTHAPLAALALAVSPLHIQASTTASSEALYLLLMVTCLERLLAALDGDRRATFAVAGLLASLAAVTRYDAWIDFPIVAVAAWIFAPRPAAADARGEPGRAWRTPRARRLVGLVIFSAVTASLPLAWIAWAARAGGDPFFFAHYISSDHAHLAATANARWGPILARARQLGIWALSFVDAMSLPLAVGAVIALRRFAVRSWPAKIVIVAALAPPALYLAKGIVFLSFEPLPRFALIPGALLLPIAAEAIQRRWPAGRWRIAVAGSAALLSAIVLVAAWGGRGRIWAGAESLGPLTRLDNEDRALARYLRAHRLPGERVFIQPLDFADIVIAHAAGVPAPMTVSLAITRTADGTVAETLASTGARWLAAYDDGSGGDQDRKNDGRNGGDHDDTPTPADRGRPPATPGWGRALAGDWPAHSLRFGHWKLLRNPALD